MHYFYHNFLNEIRTEISQAIVKVFEIIACTIISWYKANNLFLTITMLNQGL